MSERTPPSILLESILNTMPTAVVVTDISKEQIIEIANPAFLRLSRYSTEQVIGKSISLLQPDDLSRTLREEIYDNTMSGNEYNGRVMIEDSTGDRFPVLLHTSRICARDDDSKVIALQATMADLRQVERRQQLYTMGLAAAGIGHDLGNKLQGILGNLELLDTINNLDEKGKLALARALNATMEMRGIFSEFNSVGSAQKNKHSKLRLNELVASAIPEIFRNYIYFGHQVKITEVYSSNGNIFADEVGVKRVVDNIVRNSILAICSSKKGDEVLLRTYDMVVDDLIKSYTGEMVKLRGDYAILEIEDNGPGIEKKVLHKIFQPLYTGRATADGELKGTGLGLSIVDRVIQNHSGVYMSIESEVDNGALFKIYFPRTV
ncbi:PAS domain-containing protein [archaeon]|jgi:PAS domain S-box-containing protein|nr:PAS domain-containing protein [archaeon]MBT6761529.1 PAS domain-containing protein [archaeon]